MLKIRFFFSLQHKTVLRFFPNQKSKNQSKNRGTILADSQTSILSQFSTILHLDFKLAMMPIQPFNYQPPFCSPHALSSFAFHLHLVAPQVSPNLFNHRNAFCLLEDHPCIQLHQQESQPNCFLTSSSQCYHLRFHCGLR